MAGHAVQTIRRRRMCNYIYMPLKLNDDDDDDASYAVAAVAKLHRCNGGS